MNKISDQPEMQKYLKAIRDEVTSLQHGFDDPNYPDSRVLGEFYIFLSGLVKVASRDHDIDIRSHWLLLNYRTMVHHQKLKAQTAEFRMGEAA